MKLFFLIFVAVLFLWTTELVIATMMGTTLPELFTGRWWLMVCANAFLAARIANAILKD